LPGFRRNHALKLFSENLLILPTFHDY
jgi:hypothetical protein